MSTTRKNSADLMAQALEEHKKNYAMTLLDDIVESYKEKGWGRDSDVMLALKKLKENTHEFTQEDIYRGILLNVICYANHPDGQKVVAEDLEEKILLELEEKFLSYYSNKPHAYFTKNTNRALGYLRQHITSQLRENQAIKEQKAEAARAVAAAAKTAVENFLPLKKENLPGYSLGYRNRLRAPSSVAESLASTAAESTDSVSHNSFKAYAEGSVERLNPMYEYTLFRENYAILIILKQYNIQLTDEQFDRLFTSLFFISTIPDQNSAKLHEQLIIALALDKSTNRKIQRSREKLFNTYPKVLSKSLISSEEERIKIMRRMIELRGTEFSMLPNDDRFDSILEKLPLPISESTAAAADESSLSKKSALIENSLLAPPPVLIDNVKKPMLVQSLKTDKGCVLS